MTISTMKVPVIKIPVLYFKYLCTEVIYRDFYGSMFLPPNKNKKGNCDSQL